MTRLRWSPRALRDLESIREWVARDSAPYADLVVRRLVASVERLTTFPESGRRVPEVREPRIREVILRPYRIVYRVLPDEVEIVTVFRSSRLFPDLAG